MAEEKTTKQKKQTKSENPKEEPAEDTPSPSKEVKAILDALRVYAEKHDDDVQVLLGVIAYGPEGDVIDDRICLFGTKEGLRITHEELGKEIENMPGQEDEDNEE